MSLWASLAAFLGRLIREILPALYDEWRKPRTVRQVGAPDEIEDEVRASIRTSIERGVDVPRPTLHPPDPDGLHSEGPSSPPTSSLSPHHRFDRPPTHLLLRSSDSPTD